MAGKRGRVVVTVQPHQQHDELQRFGGEQGQEVADPVDRIYVQLSNYLLLREWYDDDLGVLYLK